MTAATIDGKAVADRLRARVADGVAELKAARGIVPGLAAVLVGEDPASQVYVRNKAMQCVEIGMASFEHRLPVHTPQAELLALVAALNADPAVHGILVQLPLPPQIDPQAVLMAIDPAKDVDGFHPVNVGRLGSAPAVTAAELAADPLDAGRGLDFPIPGTPLGCLMLLKLTLGSGGLRGKDALVIGRSNIVGKPMAQLLLREDCTVTVAHSRTRDLPDLCRRAEILVAAIGRPKFVPADWIRPGATVIDVGVNRIPKVEEPGKTRLVGDVDTAAAREVAGAITPVPGGVGPMTIACLLANTLRAASRT